MLATGRCAPGLISSVTYVAVRGFPYNYSSHYLNVWTSRTESFDGIDCFCKFSSFLHAAQHCILTIVHDVNDVLYNVNVVYIHDNWQQYHISQ